MRHSLYRFSPRLILVTALFFGFATAPAFGQPDETWKRFTSSEGGFNILFPSNPKLVMKDVETVQGTLKQYMYNASWESLFFITTYADFKVESTTDREKEAVLDAVRDGSVKSTNGSLVYEKKISLNGYPGREIAINTRIEDSDLVMKWRVFLVGKRLYQIGVASDPDSSDLPQVDKFLLSFALTK